MTILSRRQFVGASAAAAGSLMIPGVSRADRQTLRLGMGASRIGTIDPIKLNQGVDNWVICHVYDMLVRGPNNQFAKSPDQYVPELAERWEMSADAKTWTFHLRKGVQFHKGYGELTSADVKFSFDRARDRTGGSSQASNWTSVGEIQTPDSHTVVVQLTGPDPLFLANPIFSSGGNVVCKRAVEERGERFALDPIGTGPYQIESVRPNLVRMVANPGYFGSKPKTPNLEVHFINDVSARTFAILGGTVDMILPSAGPGAIASILTQDSNLELDVARPGIAWRVAFNLTKKPFDDVRVRRAFAYAIDRQKMSDSLTPPTPRVYGLNAPTGVGGMNADNTPAELQYNYDPKKAKALLAEAGFPNGFTFSCFSSQRDDFSSLMLIMQENLRQVGVNMDLKLMDHTAFHADNRKALNTFSLVGGTEPPAPTYPIANFALASASVKPDGKGGSNFSQYGVAMPGIDAIYEQTINEANLEKRLGLIRQMELKLLEDMPIIPVCNVAYCIVRNKRMNLGYKIESTWGFWRLTEATKSA